VGKCPTCRAKSAELTTLSELITKATACRGEKRYDEAHSFLNEIFRDVDAESGAAHSLLGMMILCGQGVEKDEEEGIRTLQKAVEEGDSSAMYELGMLYFNPAKLGLHVTKDAYVSFQYLKEALGKGHPDAICQVGLMLKSGDGIAKDTALAVQCFRVAADKLRHPRATAVLGIMYMEGDVVEQSTYTATTYLRDSLLLTSVSSPSIGPLMGMAFTVAFDLAPSKVLYAIVGFMYMTGLVIEENEEMALKYLRTVYVAKGEHPILDDFWTSFQGDDHTKVMRIMALLEKEKASTKKAVFAEVTSENATSTKATSKGATSKVPTSKKATSKEATSKRPTSTVAIAGKMSTKKAISKDATLTKKTKTKGAVKSISKIASSKKIAVKKTVKKATKQTTKAKHPSAPASRKKTSAQ